MKNWILRIGIVILTAFFTHPIQAQTWFDLGAKAGVGSGILMNKSISNDSRLSISPGFNTLFGGKLGVNFGDAHAINFDFSIGNYSFGFIQSEVDASSLSYKYFFEFKNFAIAPLYRFTKEASYLEIGPQFCFNSKPNFLDESPNDNTPNNPEEYLRKNTTNIIFGFGGYMIGNEIISLMAGLRFSYGISNLVSDTWAGSNFPLSNYADITSNNPSNNFTAQVVFELNYSLGYFVTASCGRRRAFLTF